MTTSSGAGGPQAKQLSHTELVFNTPLFWARIVLIPFAQLLIQMRAVKQHSEVPRDATYRAACCRHFQRNCLPQLTLRQNSVNAGDTLYSAVEVQYTVKIDELSR